VENSRQTWRNMALRNASENAIWHQLAISWRYMAQAYEE